MTCEKKLFAEIVPGFKAVFDLILTKEDKTPFNLTPYTALRLVFLNTAGVRTVINLSVPLLPAAGIIQVSLSSAQTASADAKWANADLELDNGVDVELKTLQNKFKVTTRNAPVITP